MPVYVTDKPLGLTSHDVVARARRALGTRRVGHTGTLDPLATGVLVLCADDSTKLVQFMEADSKDYLAWVALGAGTPTLDAEGPVDGQAEVGKLDRDQIGQVLHSFVGPQQQVPPQYSALQVGGQRAYAVARAGGQIELPARDVVVYELNLLGTYESLRDAPTAFSPDSDGRWHPDPAGRAFTLPPALGEFPTLLVWARVGSGTYLRSLARDIGAALGLPAHLAGLVRTRAGQFGLDAATLLDDLATATPVPDLAALDLPVLEATPQLALTLRQGKRPASDQVGRLVVTQGDQLVAVVDGDGRQLKVVRAWA